MQASQHKPQGSRRLEGVVLEERWMIRSVGRVKGVGRQSSSSRRGSPVKVIFRTVRVEPSGQALFPGRSGAGVRRTPAQSPLTSDWLKSSYAKGGHGWNLQRQIILWEIPPPSQWRSVILNSFHEKAQNTAVITDKRLPLSLTPPFPPPPHSSAPPQDTQSYWTYRKARKMAATSDERPLHLLGQPPTHTHLGHPSHTQSAPSPPPPPPARFLFCFCSFLRNSSESQWFSSLYQVYATAAHGWNFWWNTVLFSRHQNRDWHALNYRFDYLGPQGAVTLIC